MRMGYWLPVVAAAAMLSGCGGGGGGGVTPMPAPPPAPVPPPPPPPPANSVITDLRSNQTFATTSATAEVAFNLTSKTTISGSAAAPTLTVSFDAASNSYTVSAPGRSASFAPADVITTAVPGETRYSKGTEASSDRLTLVTTPYTGPTSNRYVGLGYWQRNRIVDARQDTVFDTFTYGFETPAAAVPRAGSGSFNIDVFGLSTTPGFEPRVFQGRGGFNVDFSAGVFSTQTYLEETELLSGRAVTGGGIELNGAGLLSASGNAFNGTMVYGGAHGAVPGTLAGKFYGPSSEELGASFSGSNKDGATVTGSFTGQRATGNPAVNHTLTNLVTSQLFYAQEALLTVTGFDGESRIDARTMKLISQLTLRTSDNLLYGPGISNLPGGEFTTASLIPSADPNFTAYEKEFNGQRVRLELYKPGNGNRELALTYASFGRWSSQSKNGVVTDTSRVFLVYGLETPTGLLSARTGSAQYRGVAYGAGANGQTGARYDVRGTSLFDVDFSNQRYSGGLALKGTSTNGMANVDFGSYDFSGRIFSNSRQSVATLSQGGTTAGELTSTFFGPTGEEVGGPFTLVVPPGAAGAGTHIAGATVAKRGP